MLLLSANIVLQYWVEEVVCEWIDNADIEQIGLLAAVASHAIAAPEVEDGQDQHVWKVSNYKQQQSKGFVDVVSIVSLEEANYVN